MLNCFWQIGVISSSTFLPRALGDETSLSLKEIHWEFNCAFVDVYVQAFTSIG